MYSSFLWNMHYTRKLYILILVFVTMVALCMQYKFERLLYIWQQWIQSHMNNWSTRKEAEWLGNNLPYPLPEKIKRKPNYFCECANSMPPSLLLFATEKKWLWHTECGVWRGEIYTNNYGLKAFESNNNNSHRRVISSVLRSNENRFLILNVDIAYFF